MDDLISRQAAIDALGEEPMVWSGKDEYEQGLNNQWRYDLNAIKAVPAAQPKIGKWNVYYHGDNDFSYSCNQCGYGAPFDKMAGKVYQRKWRYCPNCGAKMDGE